MTHLSFHLSNRHAKSNAAIMNQKGYKQAILFLTDKSSDWIIDQYKKLEKMHHSNMDVFFLYHNRNNSIPEKIQRFNLYIFTDSVLHELGYKTLEGNLIPGSNHFPLLKFYLNNKYYDYYWLVEDDVYFSGEWTHFFNTFNNDESDFITTNIHMFAEESN